MEDRADGMRGNMDNSLCWDEGQYGQFIMLVPPVKTERGRKGIRVKKSRQLNIFRNIEIKNILDESIRVKVSQIGCRVYRVLAPLAPTPRSGPAARRPPRPELVLA